MGVSHTLARRFFWSENILWKEELGEKRCTVSLAGRDLIVNTSAVGQYLIRGRKMENGVVEGKVANGHADWREQEWTGKELEVLWFPTKDHAQVFDHVRDYGRLIKVIREYSLVEGDG